MISLLDGRKIKYIHVAGTSALISVKLIGLENQTIDWVISAGVVVFPARQGLSFGLLN